MLLTELKNYTPHAVRIFVDNGEDVEPTIVTLPSIGVCRAESHQGTAYFLDAENGRRSLHHGGTPYGTIAVMLPPCYTGVSFAHGPDPDESAAVIVSVIAAPVLAEVRPDLTIFIPDTGPESVIRNHEGQITGVRQLILWHDPAPKGVSVVQPLNPANPFDGWGEIFGSHSLTREGIYAAFEEASNIRFGMLDPQGQMPIFCPKNWKTTTEKDRGEWVEAVLNRSGDSAL